jgi:hypothetical protein
MKFILTAVGILATIGITTALAIPSPENREKTGLLLDGLTPPRSIKLHNVGTTEDPYPDRPQGGNHPSTKKGHGPASDPNDCSIGPRTLSAEGIPLDSSSSKSADVRRSWPIWNPTHPHPPTEPQARSIPAQTKYFETLAKKNHEAPVSDDTVGNTTPQPISTTDLMDEAHEPNVEQEYTHGIVSREPRNKLHCLKGVKMLVPCQPDLE